MSQLNREAWLTKLAGHFDKWLDELGLERKPYTATCSWPVSGALRNAGKTIGQCIGPASVRDGRAFISISPYLDDSTEVAATLLHELLHARVGVEHGHKKPFATHLEALGLEGKPTATTAGEAFKQRLAPLLERLGPYPHAGVDVSGRKKQSTRLLKLLCDNPEHDDFIVRASQKAVDIGLPLCPFGHEMFVAE